MRTTASQYLPDWRKAPTATTVLQAAGMKTPDHGVLLPVSFNGYPIGWNLFSLQSLQIRLSSQNTFQEIYDVFIWYN